MLILFAPMIEVLVSNIMCHNKISDSKIVLSSAYVNKNSLIGTTCPSPPVILWVSCFLAGPVLLGLLIYTILESLYGVEMMPNHNNAFACHEASYFWVINDD